MQMDLSYSSALTLFLKIIALDSEYVVLYYSFSNKNQVKKNF